MEKTKCCGCRACEQICPKECIKMEYDEKGFMYPKIDRSKCIECGLCKKVCPMLNNEELKQTIPFETYRLISKDKEIIDTSSSGGAFIEIVKQILSNNKSKKYKIYGCIFDKQMKAKHIGITDVKDINKLQKSKYVQSDIGYSYKEIKQDLKEDILVIFSGTPCQIAGLKKYLIGQDTENLYTIDLVCHGVPSQKVLDKYIQYVENKYDSKIKKFNFRQKIKIGNKVDSCGVKMEFENSQIIKEYSFSNWYMLGFFGGLYYRECCGECPFANTKRVSDITIGDFWGIQKTNKNLDANTGISLCIANSNKGQKIMKEIEDAVKVNEEDIKVAIANNRNLSKPSKISPNSNEFFEKLDNSKDFRKTIKKYVRRKGILEYLISANMNEEFKNKIKNKIKR